MPTPIRKQRARPVTSKRRREKTARKRAREWKIAALAKLLEFALGPGNETLALIAEAHGLIREVLVVFRRLTTPNDLLDQELAVRWRERVEWCREQAKTAITLAANRKEWMLPISQLAEVEPLLAWHTLGGLGHWEGGLEGLWLLTLRELMSFNQGFRIRRCKQDGCDTIFVGRTTSLYCDHHSTSAEKVRRYRERMSEEKRRQQRRLHYENYLEKHKGPAVAAVARRQHAQ
jgi:hypothetical protein